MQDKVAVTQQDRDAVAECRDNEAKAQGFPGCASYVLEAIRRGDEDHTPIIQAFALHREQATASLRAHLLSDEVVERAAKNVQLHLDGFENDPRVIARATLSAAMEG